MGMYCGFIISLFIIVSQEAHKLLQPSDKTLKTMAVEFAEYQVNLNSSFSSL